MTWAIAAVAGYLLGSVPVAVLVARRDRFDPRVTGDANAGFWNVKARVGWRRSVPVLLGDTAKGAAAAGLGYAVVGSVWGAYVGGGAAMIGHAWPVFARFHGGKSILAFAGTIAVVAPLVFVLAWVVLGVIAVPTHSFAKGARAGVVAIPLLQLVFDPAIEVAATGVLMTFIGLKFLLDAVVRRRAVVRRPAV